MKRIKLNAEEKKIEQAIGRGEYFMVTGEELREVADAIAAHRKDRTLTIRVNSGDIQQIKKSAQRKGIPYQTFLSEIIHRVAMKLAAAA